MVTLSEFLDLLNRYHLLESSQLDELRRQPQAPAAEPRAVARGMINRGWLTPYQANQLLQGRGHDLLLGHYVLLERLGEGGMGQVFKARHAKFGHVVALKVIRKERLASKDAVKRFRREVRAAAHLDHPHIVRALDADEVAGTHLLVMEFVPGTDLAGLVGRRGPLPVNAACEFLRQAALGLQHAFERGLVHRDVKPSNLLLTLPPGVDAATAAEPALAAGRVKILDFGLARLGEAEGAESTTALTREGVLMGTLDYLAPEQALDSHSVDIRADLYSLGCTGYYLLAGRVPFPGGSTVAKVMRHRLDEPTPLEQLRPEVPAPACLVIRKLMAKHPDGRFGTPAETAAVLRAVLLGEPVTIVVSRPAPAPDQTLPGHPDNPFAGLEASDTTVGSSTTPPERQPAPPPRRRRPLLAAVGVCALLLLGLAMGVRALLGPGRPTPPATEPQGKSGRALSAQDLAADEAFRPLLAKWTADIDQPAEQDLFRKELLVFRVKHPGTPAALRAAELVTKLPSPLDRLDLDEKEKPGFGQPPGLVAVLGEHGQLHWGNLYAAAYSPDGKRVATAGADGVVRLWDAATRREVAALPGHPNGAVSVAFSPDGKLLASGNYYDGTVHLWDLTGPEPAQRRALAQGDSNPVWSLAFSPDGKALASLNQGGILKWWDTERGTELARFEAGGGGKGLVVASDGRRLLFQGGDGSVLWNADTGKEVCRFPGQTALFSPDGRRVASWSESVAVQLWEAETGNPTRSLEGTTGVRCVAFSPDGRHALVGGNDGTVHIWRLETGKEVGRCGGDMRVVTGVVCCPDGKHAVTASSDNTVRLWEWETGKEVRRFEGLDGFRSLSADGRHLLQLDLNAYRSWDVDTGKEEQPLTGPAGSVTGLAFTPDCAELFAASQSGTALLWDLATRTPRATFPGRLSPYSPQVAVSPDGQWLAAAIYVKDQSLTVWSRDTGEVRLQPNRGNPALAPRFSPDGRYLAAACGASGIQVWNVEDGKLLFAAAANLNPSSCDFSPTGSLVAVGGADGTVRLFEVPSGVPWRSFKVADSAVQQVLFHPDGGSFAFGGTLFDLVRSKAVFSVGGVIAAFSPDGKTFAAVAGNALTLYETATGQPLREWHCPGPVHAAAFADDGRHLATGNGNGTVYVFRLEAHPDPGPARALRPDEAARLQQAEGQRLGVPVEVANSLGMKLRLIPPGKFLMGSPAKERGHRDEEFQHEVFITRPYYLGAHKVTVGQFRAFVQDTGYRTEAERTGEGSNHTDKNNAIAPDPKCTWREPGYEQTDDHPVVCVSWNDAAAFCAWLSRQEGKPYALATEAQWEYACRAGSQTVYGFGDAAEAAGQYAWYRDNSEWQAHPVGLKKPNAWGLFDVAGDTWDWTADWFAPDYPRRSPKEDPAGPATGTARVIRGGGWNNEPVYLRAAFRQGQDAASRWDTVGFRVVLPR